MLCQAIKENFKRRKEILYKILFNVENNFISKINEFFVNNILSNENTKNQVKVFSRHGNHFSELFKVKNIFDI